MRTSKLEALRATVDQAFSRSAMYRRLYNDRRRVDSFDQFLNLPTATVDTFRSALGITDVACFDDDQLVMETNPLPSSPDQIPFSPVENEYDMERRYARVIRILRACGIQRCRIGILADASTFYFAAETERVLPWPVTIFLKSQHRASLTDRALKSLGIDCLISPIRTSIGTQLIQFNQYGAAGRGHDVLSLALIPWFAVCAGGPTFDTLDRDAADNGESGQFFLEESKRGTLLVTLVTCRDRPPAIPLVRYDTGLRITALSEHSFELLPLERR